MQDNNSSVTNHESVEQDQLSQDLVFDLLSSSRRRYVLYYLRTETESVKLIDLASEIAAWECGTTIEELTEQQRKRAYVSLYQTHVPKLDEVGLVDYDTDDGVVQSTHLTQEINKYLPKESGREIRWEMIYLSISALGVIVFSIGVNDMSVLSVISMNMAGVIILSLFTGAAVCHFFSDR